MSLRTTQVDPVPLSWLVRNHVSVFIRCLHLLDLDRLSDWPNITDQLFTAKTAQQNLQLRVKAVEWSLYRLLEVFDPGETKDKFRPFFPPAAPLQSVNLRAALYRYLSELKKTGVLGKEILLRKTMLDDCKGEKFEEMIAAVAMVVLKKTTNHSRGASATQPSSRIPESHLLPLVLAYQKTLQENLRIRAKVSRQHQEYLQKLRVAEQELALRKAEVKSKIVEVDPVVVQELRTLVNGNWIGDRAWTDVLLHGRPVRAVFSETVSLDLTSVEESEKPFENSSTTQKLVSDLDVQLRKHQNRLAEWKVIAKDLSQSRLPEPTAIHTSPTERENAQSCFTKHADLNLSDAVKHVKSDLTPEYESLLRAMRQELAGRRKDGHSVPQPPHDSLFPSEYVADEIPRTPVESQVEPTGMVVTTTPEADIHPQMVTPEQDQRTQMRSLSVERFLPTSSPVSSIDEPSSSTWIPEQRSSATAVQTRSTESPNLSTQKFAENGSSLESHTPASPTKEWMSLVDRTRASMSMFGSYKHHLDSDPHEERSDELQPSTSDDNPLLSETPPTLSHEEGRSTLLERTRQSMSMISNPKPRPRKSQMNTKSSHRSSQIFPINQFETPARKKSPKQVEWVPDSQSSTPRDKLFDEEAEYASVFKSRPKIAMSPALSPERSTVVFDSILEQDVEDLDSEGDGMRF